MNLKEKILCFVLANVLIMVLSSCLGGKRPELSGEVPSGLKAKLTEQEGHIPYYFPEMAEFGKFADGEYLGELSGAFIDRGKVKVTVENGRIAAVKIIKVTLWAPEVRKEHRIDEIKTGLPGQVVNKQSLAIDAVSGATGTTHVFKICVTRALWQASGKTDPMAAYAPY